MKNFSFLPLAIFPTLLICSLENERHKCLVMKHPENSCSKAINNGEKKNRREFGLIILALEHLLAI